MPVGVLAPGKCSVCKEDRMVMEIENEKVCRVCYQADPQKFLSKY